MLSRRLFRETDFFDTKGWKSLENRESELERQKILLPRSTVRHSQSPLK